MILLGFACLAGGLSLAGHGTGGAKPAAAGHEREQHAGEKSHKAAEGAEATPQYPKGRPLEGRFDINLFRSAGRIADLRYPLEEIRMHARQGIPWVVQVACVVEFGTASGMSEMEEHKAEFREDLARQVAQFDPVELVSSTGKRRLKEGMIEALNRRLVTAQVRQIYFTEFRVLK